MTQSKTLKRKTETKATSPPPGRTGRNRFAKGNKCSKGRPKGTQNKFTDLKKAFFGVFERIENEAKTKKTIDSFYQWATKNQKNQGEFYKMLSKMLPTNVTLEGDLPIIFEVSEKFMPKKEGTDAGK